MRFLSALLIVCIIQMGCSSSSVVSSFNTFNVDVYDRSATIVFHNGSELDGRNIIASPDSTRFLNEKTDAITVVPTHTIRTVVLTSAGAGFLDGLEWGAGIGAVMGFTLGYIAHGSGEHDVAYSMGAGAIEAAVGGVIGGIIGVGVGHSYNYQFVPSSR